MTINPETILTDLVPDDAMNRAFEGTRFGGTPPRVVLRETVLKIAGGYHT